MGAGQVCWASKHLGFLMPLGLAAVQVWSLASKQLGFLILGFTLGLCCGPAKGSKFGLNSGFLAQHVKKTKIRNARQTRQ